MPSDIQIAAGMQAKVLHHYGRCRVVVYTVMPTANPGQTHIFHAILRPQTTPTPFPPHRPSYPFPILKLLLQMLLQPRKPPPKPPPTPPTHQLILQIHTPPSIPLHERKLLQPHEKRRRKAVIMLPMLHTLANPIHTQHMDMQMRHRRMRMHAHHDLLLPIPPRRQNCRRRIRGHGGVACCVGGGEVGEATAEFGGGVVD